jgi:hypothetical protein
MQVMTKDFTGLGISRAIYGREYKLPGKLLICIRIFKFQGIRQENSSVSILEVRLMELFYYNQLFIEGID